MQNLLERVSHRMMLCLESDLDDLHRTYDDDRFGDTGSQTGFNFRGSAK